MARYSDEAWDMIEDSRDKKITAQSARSRRGNCGKRGGVKMPSDSLTAKQRETMNGECKTWRLNSPMSWETFTSMPKDLQKEYIQKLRKRFGVCDFHIARMMNIGLDSFEELLSVLKLGKVSVTDNVEDFWKWCNRERLA
jgi:hypothetical protein